MHPELGRWVIEVAKTATAPEKRVVLCPDYTRLYEAASLIHGTALSVGAQNCHAEEEGAFTGEVSAKMLKAANCAYVILGHSERRQQHQESSALVQQKARAALAHDIMPIICVGESEEEREAGLEEKVVRRQLTESLPSSGSFLVAYEPVWAIGTGKTANTDDIASMHAFIKKTLESPNPVLYGGSVKPDNAADILAISSVDGVLVGSGSLKADSFNAIIEAG